MRRWTAVATAVLLVVEALVSGLVGYLLGAAVTRQDMSLGGLAPSAMAAGAWAGLGLLAVFLLLAAAVVARTGLRRSMGRPTRILLIVCAVLHGVLGAMLLALSGVTAFAVAALTLTLLVLLLFLPDDSAPAPLLLPEAAPTPAP